MFFYLFQIIPNFPYQEINYAFNIFLGIFKAWWWLPLPFILFKQFTYLWLWWRQEIYSKSIKKVLLEIKIPEEIPKPVKAMENVFSGFWAIYEDPNWKDKWIDGKYILSFSLEIISLEGEIHFLIRIPEIFRSLIEANIYAQYPDAEISEFQDYTKLVPKDIPNKDWDLWGCSYQTLKEDVYPLKTYAKFFEEKGEGITEEVKRIDPIASLVEGLAKLKKGEQMWIQFIIKPITNKENNFIDRGKAIINKIVKRPGKSKEKLIFREAAEILIYGLEEEKKEAKEMIWPELMLTPGERESVKAIEDKIGKYSFECSIRFIYLGKREVFFKPNLKIPIGFFVQFSTQNLNGLKPWNITLPGAVYLFADRRNEFRKKRLLRLYKERIGDPLWPRSAVVGGKQGVFVLNTEELATLFHFPSQVLAPTPAIKRIEAKRGEAPPGLPTE